MPLMVHAQIDPVGKAIVAGTIVVTETPIEVPADRVAIYALANVPLYRQVEIVNAWQWLWNGVKDRNLLDVQFAGSTLYSGASVDNITASNRRTESTIASFDPEDIAIGMGATVTGLFKGAVVPLASAFEQLREAAMQGYFKLN